MAQASETPEQATGSEVAYGIDISEFQGHIDWDQISKSGLDFIYIRASEGITIKDHQFRDNWESAKRLKLMRGAYHFYIVGDAVEDQMRNFTSQFTPHTGDLAPMIDIEHASLIKGRDVSTSLLQEDFIRLLERIKHKFECDPIIYTSYLFANKYLDDYRFSEYRLWIADYTKNSSPLIPEAWREKGWFIWQFETKKGFPGISTNNGSVDRDMSSADKKAFKKRATCAKS